MPAGGRANFDSQIECRRAGDRVCDGGYRGAAELEELAVVSGVSGLAESAKLPLEGRGWPRTGVWLGRGAGMRDRSGISGVRGVLVVTFGRGGCDAP